MRVKSVVDIICYTFFLLFVYTGVSKFFIYDAFIFDLERDPMIGTFWAKTLAVTIPTAEILISILLLTNKGKKLGLLSTSALMILFTLYVALMINSPIRHCTCGGVIREMSWQVHLWFNVFFSVLSIIGTWLYIRKKYPTMHEYESSMNKDNLK